MDSQEQIAQIIQDAHKIIIIQADNPDADSLASALALETVLHDLGKEPVLYCGVDVPQYLRYLPGWDRVLPEIPTKFDASIIVDTSSTSLLEKLSDSPAAAWVASRPVIVLDHHGSVQDPIQFATVTLNNPEHASTGSLIFELAHTHKWPLSTETADYIMTSILADTMGLTTESVSADTYRIMAELVEAGANRPKLEEGRRAFGKMQEEIFRYKAALISRTQFFHDNAVALVVIPQDEINTYSPLYNPAPLIQPDHLQTEGVQISVVMKSYDNGRVTGAIRCNYGTPIASKVARELGGGGHDYAAGFKIEKGSLAQVQQSCIAAIETALSNLTPS